MTGTEGCGPGSGPIAPKCNGGWCRHQPPLSQVQVADARGQRFVSLGRFGSAREVAFARFPCSKTIVARTSVSPGGFLEVSVPLRSGLAPWSFASRRLPPPSRLCFAALHPCGIRAVSHRLMAWELSSVSGRSFRPRAKALTLFRVAPSEIDLWIKRISGIKNGPLPKESDPLLLPSNEAIQLCYCC